jgi:hypothetical protein
MLLIQKPCHSNGGYMHATGFAVFAEGLHIVTVSFCYKWQFLSLFPFIYLLIYLFICLFQGTGWISSGMITWVKERYHLA